MGDKKKLPMGLVEKQELQRQETINKVLRAIVDIKNEDKDVTIAALVEYTGLARSTFAKPHVRELLVEYGFDFCDKVLSASKRKKAKQVQVNAEKDRVLEELKAKNVELEKECELLRGKLFLCLHNNILK